MANILELRLSFIFIEAFDDLLTSAQPQTLPFGFLARNPTYVAAFDHLLHPNTAAPQIAPGLTLPWQVRPGKSFWTLYLGPAATALSGRKAWDQLVPLRQTFPAKIEAPWINGHITTDALFYPHAVAFILTMSCRGPFTIAQAIQAALDARSGGKFNVTWPNQPQTQMKLDMLGDAALLHLRAQALGAKAPHSPYRPDRPFSIATIVRGQELSAADAPAQDSEIHHLLDVLASWNPAWPKQPPPQIAEQALPTDSSGANDVLYSARRGRAAWIPSCFAPQAKTMRKMSCYHRNLTLASAQMESLAGLCLIAVDAQANGTPPQGAFAELCMRGTELIGRLYGGARTTYRSASIPRQIIDNQWVHPINQVRKLCGRPPLS